MYRIDELITRLKDIHKYHGNIQIAVSINGELPDLTRVYTLHDDGQTDETIVVLEGE